MQQLLIDAHAKLCLMFPGCLISVQVSCANYCGNADPEIYLYACLSRNRGKDWTTFATAAKSIAELIIKAEGYARTQHRITAPVHDSAVSEAS